MKMRKKYDCATNEIYKKEREIFPIPLCSFYFRGPIRNCTNCNQQMVTMNLVVLMVIIHVDDSNFIIVNHHKTLFYV